LPGTPPNTSPIRQRPDDEDGDVVIDADAANEEEAPEAPLPGVSSAPALHTDAYNTIQSNLTLARECIATALTSLQPNSLPSFGEDRAAIPNLQDLDDYKATTSEEVRKIIKKLTSLVNQCGGAIAKHTKVARRLYIQRVGAPIAAEYQRRQAEINRRQSDINRERERLRQQQVELEELQRQNRRRPAQRAR